MSASELMEYPDQATVPRCVGEDSDWYTLTYWPQSRALRTTVDAGAHHTTGQCYTNWETIERAAEDATNQARHFAKAMLAIREQASATY
jgi:hypothetical protein